MTPQFKGCGVFLLELNILNFLMVYFFLVNFYKILSLHLI